MLLLELRLNLDFESSSVGLGDMLSRKRFPLDVEKLLSMDESLWIGFGIPLFRLIDVVEVSITNNLFYTQQKASAKNAGNIISNRNQYFYSLFLWRFFLFCHN